MFLGPEVLLTTIFTKKSKLNLRVSNFNNDFMLRMVIGRLLLITVLCVQKIIQRSSASQPVH